MKKPKLQNVQFDDFWELVCPKCGEKIDLEVLINIFKRKRDEK
jgi:hypothetical protein